MRKILVAALLVSLIAVGCTAPKTNDNTSPAAQTEQKPAVEQEAPKTPKEISDEFDKMVAENKRPAEIMRFIDKYIEKTDKSQGTKMTEGLIKRQNDEIVGYMEKMHAGNNYQLMTDYFGISFDAEKIKGIKEADLKALLQEIVDGGYKIFTVEGDYALALDYEKLKKYNGFISNELKDFIALEAEESNRPSVMDDGFLIPIEEVAARIAKAEEYYRSYPKSPRGEKIGELNQARISLYLSGLGNTPVFDYQINKINVDYLRSYKKTVKDYDGTVFAAIVKDYLKVIEKHSFSKSQEALDFPSKNEILRNYTEYVKQGLPK